MQTTQRPVEREESQEPPDGDRRETIVVRGLEKTYGSGEDAVTAVDDVSFAVEAGTVVGVLGPNGAGKTTAIKSMLGLVRPDAGTVELAGIDVSDRPRAVYRRVGAMLEGARNVYWKLTVRENLEFFATLGGESPAGLRERHEELLDQLGLAEKADTPVNDLSRGMKQKVSLACALARDVEVAVLDEPTLGLDVESSVELRDELRRLAEREEVTILLSSHDMDVVQAVCDRVIIVNEGRIVADETVDDLIDLFRTQAYEVTLDGDLGKEVRVRFERAYDATEWDQRGERLTFTVTLPEGEALYDLMDDLRATGRTVESVDAVEPDLEEVFMEVIESGGTGR